MFANPAETAVTVQDDTFVQEPTDATAELPEEKVAVVPVSLLAVSVKRGERTAVVVPQSHRNTLE
jgi:hypothetical protein